MVFTQIAIASQSEIDDLDPIDSGQVVYNTTTGKLQMYINGTWKKFSPDLI